MFQPIGIPRWLDTLVALIVFLLNITASVFGLVVLVITSIDFLSEKYFQSAVLAHAFPAAYIQSKFLSHNHCNNTNSLFFPSATGQSVAQLNTQLESGSLVLPIVAYWSFSPATYTDSSIIGFNPAIASTDVTGSVVCNEFRMAALKIVNATENALLVSRFEFVSEPLANHGWLAAAFASMGVMLVALVIYLVFKFKNGLDTPLADVLFATSALIFDGFSFPFFVITYDDNCIFNKFGFLPNEFSGSWTLESSKSLAAFTWLWLASGIIYIFATLAFLVHAVVHWGDFFNFGDEQEANCAFLMDSLKGDDSSASTESVFKRLFQRFKTTLLAPLGMAYVIGSITTSQTDCLCCHGFRENEQCKRGFWKKVFFVLTFSATLFASSVGILSLVLDVYWIVFVFRFSQTILSVIAIGIELIMSFFVAKSPKEARNP